MKIINKHKVHKFVNHKLVNFILFHYLCCTDEAAVIHAALLKKCQAGDMDAIRLWTELQKESGSGAAEVNIVDSI